jgi:hypothetical protein
VPGYTGYARAIAVASGVDPALVLLAHERRRDAARHRWEELPVVIRAVVLAGGSGTRFRAPPGARRPVSSTERLGGGVG